MLAIMGAVLGKVTVETPSHAVVRTGADGAYEIRRYGSSVAAEVRSTDWAAGMSERGFSKVAFPTLARYIGVFGDGENVARGGGADGDAAACVADGADAGAAAASAAGADGGKPEKMAMTAPVIMASTTDGAAAAGDGDSGKPEKMAMTAPVVMASTSDETAVAGDGDGGEHEAAATGGGFTMAFLLPAKYKAAADAPRPTNDKVHLMDVPPRTVAVRKYSGNTTMDSCWEHVKGLLDALARDGVATTGPWTLQRYNPPFSLPWTKTNEIHVPVEVDAAAEAASGEGGALAAAVPA